MKIGLAVAANDDQRIIKLVRSLESQGLKTAFIIYCFGENKFIFYLKRLLRCLRHRSFKGFLFGHFLPLRNSRIYYSTKINSRQALRIFLKEKPEIVIVYGCGIIGQKLCELFPKIFINAHAGKLPEFRGMNSVEWTYFENQDLFGTIHFIAKQIDTGEIIYEEKIAKLKPPTNIDKIRADAFDKVWLMVPKALKVLQRKDFVLSKQSQKRTTRYIMHPYLKHLLNLKLAKKEDERQGFKK